MKTCDSAKFIDKIQGCWFGKAIGGGFGTPFEGTPDAMHLAPEELVLDPGPNDDLEMQLLWLVQAEKYGASLDASRLAEAWKNHIGYGMDEYGVALRNLRRGVEPPYSGYADNAFFGDGMGAVIRSELWSCLSPGKPEQAAWFASQDATVDHFGDGVWGEILLAAAGSIAIVNDDPAAALRDALAFLPPESRVAQAVRFVFDLCESGVPQEELRGRIMEKFGHWNFTDCVMNLAFITAGILVGGGDFDRTVTFCINCGKDTDCTAASSAALLGLAGGTAAIPQKYRDILDDRIAVSDFLETLTILPRSLQELKRRIFTLAERLESELESTGRELRCSYRPLTEDVSHLLPHSSFWVFTGISAADAERIEAELRAAGPGANLYPERRRDFAGTILDLSEYSDQLHDIHCFTFARCAASHPDGLVMCASNAGSTLWIDGRMHHNYQGRLKIVPAFHRTEGGSTFGFPLEANRPYLMRIQLRFPPRDAHLTVALGEKRGFYLDDYTLTV